jgi:hypothetical protein
MSCRKQLASDFTIFGVLALYTGSVATVTRNFKYRCALKVVPSLVPIYDTPLGVVRFRSYYRTP